MPCQISDFARLRCRDAATLIWKCMSFKKACHESLDKQGRAKWQGHALKSCLLHTLQPRPFVSMRLCERRISFRLIWRVQIQSYISIADNFLLGCKSRPVCWRSFEIYIDFLFRWIPSKLPLTLTKGEYGEKNVACLVKNMKRPNDKLSSGIILDGVYC